MQRIEKRRERDGHKRSLNSVLNVLQPKPHPQRTNAACGWARENLSTKHDHTACATDRNAKGSRQTESSEDDQAMRLSFITSEELVSCVQSFDFQPTVISPTKKKRENAALLARRTITSNTWPYNRYQRAGQRLTRKKTTEIIGNW